MHRRRLLVAAVVVLIGAGTAAGVVVTRSPASGYASIAWTRGQSTQMRYCYRSTLGPGVFLAASKGVTCQTAEAIIRKVRSSSCYLHARCETNSFQCLGYFGGQFGTFDVEHHALCSNRSRRVEWDGG